MKLFHIGKDGGPESKSTGYWLIEAKRLFSIALIRFDGKAREAFHTHSFHAVSWLLKGQLIEQFIDGTVRVHKPSLKPIVTLRSHFHIVDSVGTSWAITFRGPWVRLWKEFLPKQDTFVTLSPGRKIESWSTAA